MAALNKKRNDGPVHALRNDWGTYQGYARTKKAAEEQPANTGLADQLKKLDEKIAGMDERVAQRNAEAKAIEDEIFKINQPKPHKYELRRVDSEPVARP